MIDTGSFQKLEKGIFINKLGQAFAEFAENGDAFFICYKGLCDSEICNYKCGGFSFVENILII